MRDPRSQYRTQQGAKSPLTQLRPPATEPAPHGQRELAAPSPPVALSTFFANYCSNRWLSHIVFSLCQKLAQEHPRSSVRLFVPGASTDVRRESFVRAPLTDRLQDWIYGLRLEGPVLKRLQSRAFRHALASSDVAYFWPGADPELYAAARERGLLVAHEMINTTVANARRVLDAESEASGLRVAHAITDEEVALENERLSLSDLIFAPSPLVAASLHAAGIDEHRICRTSYGWSPERIRVRPRDYRLGPDGLQVLFVGRLSLRKGVHRLLEAWEAADIDGELLLCGRVSKEVQQQCGDDLHRRGVICLGHLSDVSRVFDRADVFVLPSFEEGSPLVTYEAMAKGLPAIVSPAGAGGVLRNGKDGLVVAPGDTEGWAAALQRLAHNTELREAFGRSAMERARHFTWRAVARRRFRALQERLAQER